MRLFLPLILAAALSAQADPWLYQLQNPNPRAIAKSGFRQAVIDYSRGGGDDTMLRRGEIKALQRKGIRVLAYFSIGEAENYRFYWDPAWVSRENSNDFTSEAPSWLGHTNPDWLGNYKVRYWDPDWRDSILKPYLDRILGQGFDGVYLDIIDAFEYWGAPSSYGTGRETFTAGDPKDDEAEAARRMIDLVAWIASYGRSHGETRFLVFPQNGENILRYDRDGKYLRAVSGIGVEDVFYDETHRQPDREIRYRMKFLRKFSRAKKTVLCVDYVDDGRRSSARNQARIAEFVSRCEDEGFDFYAARKDRELDRINAIPGVQP